MTSLLPPASIPLERALELLASARLNGVDVPLRPLWSAADCPADVLPWLAWGLSIDSWDSAWPLPMRRARVASAIPVQRRKGTKQSVTEVVASFGGTIAVREWFEATPPAIPHTFQLYVSLSGAAALEAGFIDAVIADVRRTKPARSHFSFVQGIGFAGGIGLVPALRSGVHARIEGTAPVATTPAAALTLGGIPLTLGGEFLTIGS